MVAGGVSCAAAVICVGRTTGSPPPWSTGAGGGSTQRGDRGSMLSRHTRSPHSYPIRRPSGDQRGCWPVVIAVSSPVTRSSWQISPASPVPAEVRESMIAWLCGAQLMGLMNPRTLERYSRRSPVAVSSVHRLISGPGCISRQASSAPSGDGKQRVTAVSEGCCLPKLVRLMPDSISDAHSISGPRVVSPVRKSCDTNDHFSRPAYE